MEERKRVIELTDLEAEKVRACIDLIEKKLECMTFIEGNNYEAEYQRQYYARLAEKFA